jgi:flagellar protein FliS
MNDFEKGKIEYLRTKVLTASPEELHLMLYDGAIRFAEDAKAAFLQKDLEKAHEYLVRTQNILLEMSSGLDHTINPSLTAKMSSLFNFIYRRLVEANMKHDTALIDDALRILNYQRETWALLMNKLTEERKQQNPSEPKDDADLQSEMQEFLAAEPGFSLSISA